MGWWVTIDEAGEAEELVMNMFFFDSELMNHVLLLYLGMVNCGSPVLYPQLWLIVYSVSKFYTLQSSLILHVRGSCNQDKLG